MSPVFVGSFRSWWNVDETWLVEKKETRAGRGGIRRSTKATNNAPRTNLSNADLRLKPRSVSFTAVLIRGCNLRPWRIYLAHISRHPSRYPRVSCRRELHDKTEIDGPGLEMFAGLLTIRKSIRRRRGWLVGENANGPALAQQVPSCCMRAYIVNFAFNIRSEPVQDLLQTDLWHVWRFDRREYSVNYDSLPFDRTKRVSRGN